MGIKYEQLYNESLKHPNKFWLEQAKKLKWFEEPKTALEQNKDDIYNWFPDGKTNLSYLCIDKHIEDGHGEDVAMIYDSAVRHWNISYTYNEMKENVEKIAGGLKKLGVQKGDTVVIYMPMIPHAIFSMLACVRIGAIHSVVFGGFAPKELATRIDDTKPKVLITATSGIEIDKIIPYKPMVDDAIDLATHKPEKVIVYNRELGADKPEQDYDIDYEELIKNVEPATYLPVESTHPSHILHTSSTTGKPKGILRDTGGYATVLKFSMQNIYGMNEGEIWWAVSDIGWIVGHSFICYGPMINRNPTILFEGKPTKTPDASAFWRVIERHKVKAMFSAPTAFRAIKREDPNGDLIKNHDISSLKYLFFAGEKLDEPTYNWAKEKLQIPVINHWWKTESGWPVTSNFMGLDSFDIKEGSVGKAVPGYQVQVLNENGEITKTNEEGFVVLKLPTPPGFMQTIWNNNDDYKTEYLKRFPGFYFSGDAGFIDEDNYVHITGRVDDIINVSGHRISAKSIEKVIENHPAIAECVVLGVDDDLRGQTPHALIVLKIGQEEYERFRLQTEIIQLVRNEIGAVASLKTISVVKRLPKTNSGEVLRHTLEAMVNGKKYSIPSSIEDSIVVDELIEQFKEEKIGAFKKGKKEIASSLKVLADSYYNIDSLAKYIDVYRISKADPLDFWNTIATNNFYWREKWDEVLEWDKEDSRVTWFKNAKLNITENCIDRHLEKNGERTAIIFEPNDPKEEAQHISYNELYKQVNRMANVLKKNGVKKGDRVCVYLPMIPELAYTVLACARIGAIHSVVFAGFSAKALASRVNDSSCKLIVTSDGSYRGNKTIDLKKIVDEALTETPSIETCLVVKRIHSEIDWVDGRDKWLDDELVGVSNECEAEEMDAEDPLFILYTSGSTGKPKGMVHTSAGYMVYSAFTFKNVFQYKENDIYWCTADIGWITGHSYILYGPLINGATTMIFEGVPSYPDYGRFWEIVEKHKVTQFYTAPTAIRALAKQEENYFDKYDLSTLKVLGSVGEPINEEAWHWYNDHIGKKKCPIVDTWWQTETGGIMIAPIPFVTPTKPTYATLPLPGIQPVLMDADGSEIDGNQVDGSLCIQYPWPGMARTVYGDHERYKNTYFSAFKNKYFTGDGALRDEVGYYRITGRVDDVIIVSGHNLGTAPIEDAINEHPAVSESAIVGYPHDVKGNALYGYITLKEEGEGRDKDNLRKEINKLISDRIGPIAKLDKIQFTNGLPKTRSGKIMRRILRKIAANDTSNLGDTSTLLNPEIIQEIIDGVL